MTLTIDFAAVPVSCWWWSGLAVWCLLCWFWWAPAVTKRWYREWGWPDLYEVDMVAFWVFAPVSVPVRWGWRFVRKTTRGLLFGGQK